MEKKLNDLKGVLAGLESVVVAYSGGLDSTFLLAVAHDVLGDQVLALTAVSPSVPRREIEGAKHFAKKLGVPHLLIDSHETEDPRYAANPIDRCYFCKSELYTLCEKKAEELGFRVILNGTNQDDLSDWRPGLRAAEEFQVRAPLLEVGLTKEEIRELARRIGLKIWNKPASPCLASRFPYETPITPERLRQVEQVEDFLATRKFRLYRARYYGEEVRIELGKDEIGRVTQEGLRSDFQKVIQQAGFSSFQLLPFRSGGLNKNVLL